MRKSANLRALEAFDQLRDVRMEAVFTKRDIREAFMLGHIRGTIVEAFDAYSPYERLRWCVTKRGGVIVGERISVER